MMEEWPISPALADALCGFGVPRSHWEMFGDGLMVMGEFESHGGDPVTVILDLQGTTVCCGILSIHNLSGQAHRDFLKFRQLAFVLTRAAGAARLLLSGYEVVNKDVERFLRYQGFVETTREIPPELHERLGVGLFHLLVKEIIMG